MRDLDKRQIMTSDFILLYGDIIANFPLDAALTAHRARRAKDKNAIMTMVLRAAGPSHRSKAQGNSPVFVIDPSKDRCLHYEQMSPAQPHHHIEIDPELIATHLELDVRHDLIDAGIDICTPDVLALWSDNFDYEAPRRGFLHSVLKDYELNGKTIHTHVVESRQYAARVRNLHAYDAVSKDILGRWAWPMCPDSNMMKDGAYTFGKGNVYVEDGADVALSARIGRNTQIGRGSTLGVKTSISGSVIGRNCTIGEGCTIEDSYIWDGAVVGNGCVVQRAIVADDAVIGNNCTIEDGALVSYGVRIPNDRTVSSRKRLTRTKRGRGGMPALSITDTDGDEGQDYMPSDDEDVDAKAGLAGRELCHLLPSSPLTNTLSSIHQPKPLAVRRLNLHHPLQHLLPLLPRRNRPTYPQALHRRFLHLHRLRRIPHRWGPQPRRRQCQLRRCCFPPRCIHQHPRRASRRHRRLEHPAGAHSTTDGRECQRASSPPCARHGAASLHG